MDADTLGVIVSLIAAMFVGRQTYAHFIRNRAFGYIERFNHKDFMELRIIIEQWLSENKGISSLGKLLKSNRPEDIEMSVKIKTYLNLFQELAVAFEKGMVDKHIFYRNFDFLIVSNWEKFSDFIYAVRVLNNDYTIYKRFEQMAAEVKGAKLSDENEGKVYVFGYGSLMLPESIHKTLQRSDERYDLIDAKLCGYKRGWDIVIPLYSDQLQQEINALFVNIRRDERMKTGGVIFAVSKEELEKLKHREVNYDCLEVTPFIESSIPLGEKDVVVTFVGEYDHLRDHCHEKVYVMQRYLDVLRKIEILSQERYRELMVNSFEAEIIEGTYTFRREK